MVDHNASVDGGQLASRLEHVQVDLNQILNEPGVAKRLRTPAGPDEWSVLEILGHMVEMIPYWMDNCRTLIAAVGAPPRFGRTLDDETRLAGVAHGATSDLDQLMRQLDQEIKAAASMIRVLTPAELGKTGIHNRVGEVTVGQAINDFVVTHAEQHTAQVRATLAAGG